MIPLNKFVYSLILQQQKKKKVIKISAPKFSNKKILINFFNNFYELYFYTSIFSKIRKKKSFIFFIKYNCDSKKKLNNKFNLYFKFLKKTNRILHYNSIFLKLIESFSSNIHSMLWKYPYDEDPSEILIFSGYFSSKKTKFSLQNARNQTYERIFIKGWFI